MCSDYSNQFPWQLILAILRLQLMGSGCACLIQSNNMQSSSGLEQLLAEKFTL